MKNQKKPLIGIGIIVVGIASMTGAIVALTRTEKGKEVTKNVGDQTSKYAGKATELASDYMESRRPSKGHESSDFARYLFETWGQVKGRGRVIEHIDVHLEDGSNYRLRADKLAESVKRELIGRAEHL